jgi:hypothetical protein
VTSLMEFINNTPPHRLLYTMGTPSCLVKLGGKSICVDVEVLDASLDYNLLLGRSWTYAMTIVVSRICRIICFPREERIVAID